jgi:large subunit ribosomal protein L3
MTLGLLGTKLGMTHLFSEDGEIIPVTVVQVGPCPVVQVKTADSDGYSAIQIGYGDRRESAVKRAERAATERAKAREEKRRPKIKRAKQTLLTASELGHATRANVAPPKVLRELRLESVSDYEVGQVLTCDLFEAGERIDIIGTSKGRGFAGTIKRHHSSRGPETHGSRYHRRPGSMGACSTPSRIRKGKIGAGQLGAERVTVLNLKVVQCDTERNLLLIQGAVPGPNGGLVMVRKSVRTAQKSKRKAA